MKYTVCDNERLRMLCIRNDWFTEGTVRQYQKLFRANEEKAPIEEIATIIWLCTDETEWCRRGILAELQDEKERYNRLFESSERPTK